MYIYMYMGEANNRDINNKFCKQIAWPQQLVSHWWERKSLTEIILLTFSSKPVLLSITS